MTTKLLKLLPAFFASGLLNDNFLRAECTAEADDDIVCMQLDHVLNDSISKRNAVAFGANRSGDYYEGALPP
jgi:hypothetical protein